MTNGQDQRQPYDSWQPQQYDPATHQRGLQGPPQDPPPWQQSADSQQGYGQQNVPQGQPWQPQPYNPAAEQQWTPGQPYAQQQPGYGQPPWPPQQPGHQPGRPRRRKSWPARHKVLTGLIGFSALIVIGGIASVAGSPSKPAAAPTTPATQAAAPPSSAPPETAAPTPTPPPTAVTYRGVGAKVLKLNMGSDPMALTIKDVGSSNFVVWNLDSSGNKIDLLVNTIGNYSGTRLIDAMQGQQTAALQIEADGRWSVTLKPLAMLRVWDGTGTWTGKGDDLVVIQSGAFSGLDSVQITNSGQSNFAVWAYGQTKDLLVNEIGNYSGEQLMPTGTVLLEIESDGTWSLHKA